MYTYPQQQIDCNQRDQQKQNYNPQNKHYPYEQIEYYSREQYSPQQVQYQTLPIASRIHYSAFIPSPKDTWEQVDSQYFKELTKRRPKQTIKKDSTTSPENKKPNNRRYRQNELKRKIPKLEIELETLKVKHSGCNDPLQSEYLLKKIKELSSTVKQKKRHLLRLEKNMTAQEAIRNKKSNSSQ